MIVRNKPSSGISVLPKVDVNVFLLAQMHIIATVVTSRAISHALDVGSRLNIYFPNNKYK